MQIIQVTKQPLRPGTVCAAHETPVALKAALEGSAAIDQAVTLPTLQCGRVRVKFAGPLAAPLAVTFSAALSEQPFMRDHVVNVAAGETEVVFPRGRFALTQLRRVRSSAPAGVEADIDFLQWDAQPATSGSELICGVYSGNARESARVGMPAQLSMRGLVPVLLGRKVLAGDNLVAGANGSARERTIPGDETADTLGTADIGGDAGDLVPVLLDIQPAP